MIFVESCLRVLAFGGGSRNFKGTLWICGGGKLYLILKRAKYYCTLRTDRCMYVQSDSLYGFETNVVGEERSLKRNKRTLEGNFQIIPEGEAV